MNAFTYPTASPQATFQAMLQTSCWQASRSDRPSNACNTITVAMTSAGIEGRPRPEGNRSANSWSGNSSGRWSARKP
jgi:hypothetical protein